MTARENLTTQNFVFIELDYYTYGIFHVCPKWQLNLKCLLASEAASLSEATMSIMKYGVQIQAKSIGRETSPH